MNICLSNPLNAFGIKFPPCSASYASFLSTATQPLTTSAETLVSYTEKTIGTSDIVLLSSTEIQFTRSGVYQVFYSLQCDNGAGGGGNADIEVYIKIDGVALPNSNTRTNIANATEVSVTCDYILQLTAGQVVEVAVYTTGSGLVFPYFAPVGTAPATPSAIVTIQQIA